MPKTIVAFGEVLWDILPDDSRKLGGAPFNFIHRVNTLGDKGIMVSRLGQDDLGREALRKIQTLGVDTGFLQSDPSVATGTVRVEFHKTGPSYTIVPGVAYDNIEMTEALLTEVSSADCLAFGTLVQRSHTSRQTLLRILDEFKGIVFLDINLRPECYSQDTIAGSLERCHALKLNEEELKSLAKMFGLAAESVAGRVDAVMERWQLQYCVVTLGERGTYALVDSATKAYVPGYGVSVADTVGSGDAFAAGFIHKVLNGADLHEACDFGNVLGAIVATKVGGTELVSPSDIAQFRVHNHERIVHPEFR